MIEINLLPGSAKRQKQRLPSFGGGPLAKLKLPKVDRFVGMIALAWVAGLGITAWMHFSSTAKLNQVQLDVQAAQRDSTRLFKLRELNDSLQAQREEVAARLELVQEIDAGRFTWAHILDEVARALPQYTWLVNLTDAASDSDLPRIKVEGRTGNTFALAKFMEDLEASPFLQRVELISQTSTQEGQKKVYAFVLEFDYENPPPDVIQVQPLFTQAGELNADTGAPADSAGKARPDSVNTRAEGN